MKTLKKGLNMSGYQMYNIVLFGDNKNQSLFQISLSLNKIHPTDVPLNYTISVACAFLKAFCFRVRNPQSLE